MQNVHHASLPTVSGTECTPRCSLHPPATFMVRADVFPMSRKTVRLSAKAAMQLPTKHNTSVEGAQYLQ